MRGGSAGAEWDAAWLVELAGKFATIGRRLSGHGESESVLDVLTAVAAAEVPSAQRAGVTLGTKGRFTTVAATDDVVRAVDQIQYDLGSGPCVDAAVEDSVYRADDLRSDERWPEFGTRAANETGVLSMLSFRLYLEDDDSLVGALNMYSDRPSAFDDEALGTGLLLATHGALAVSGAHARKKAANLMNALSTSRDIGVAMGIVMSQLKVDREQAFDLLRIASQHTHRKLADLALEVADTGALPSIGARRRPSPVD
ncbi:MAG: hypothetical protein QOE97_2352 [Pseudonocardiales bacterium]|nr:hypothetical protein [Pseudonocardiales bacterium]